MPLRDSRAGVFVDSVGPTRDRSDQRAQFNVWVTLLHAMIVNRPSSDCLLESSFPRSGVDSPFGSVVVYDENPPGYVFVKFYLYSSLTIGVGRGLVKYANIFPHHRQNTRAQSYNGNTHYSSI